MLLNFFVQNKLFKCLRFFLQCTAVEPVVSFDIFSLQNTSLKVSFLSACTFELKLANLSDIAHFIYLN